jgi:hypothetical protein
VIDLHSDIREIERYAKQYEHLMIDLHADDSAINNYVTRYMDIFRTAWTDTGRAG